MATTARTPQLGGSLDPLLKMAAAGGGASLVTLIAWKLVSEAPQKVIDALIGFGPWFFVVLMIGWFVDQRIREGFVLFRDNVAAQTNNAAANAKLADAVQSLAKRDDEREREMGLVLSTLARRSEQTLAIVESLQAAKTSAAAAGG